MEKIKTIEELINALNKVKEGESYLDTLKNAEISIDDMERYYTWNRDNYTRNCLMKTDKYELLLICYEKGQQTPIHDYNSNNAWVHTIHGKLKEERFQKREDNGELEQVSSMTIGTNEYSYVSGYVGIHRYINVYESRTVSLNLYTPPVEKWNEYDETTGKLVEKQVGHDSIYV